MSDKDIIITEIDSIINELCNDEDIEFYVLESLEKVSRLLKKYQDC